MIVMRETDGMMDGVIDTEVELGVLMYVLRFALMPSLTSLCNRSGTGIETLVIIEIDQGTDTGMMMDIAPAVGIGREIDEDLVTVMQ